MWKLGTRLRSLISGNICFEFAVQCTAFTLISLFTYFVTWFSISAKMMKSKISFLWVWGKFMLGGKPSQSYLLKATEKFQKSKIFYALNPLQLYVNRSCVMYLHTVRMCRMVDIRYPITWQFCVLNPDWFPHYLRGQPDQIIQLMRCL
jgi:hypothetical protein